MNFELSFDNNKENLNDWQNKVRNKFLELINYNNIPQNNWRILKTKEDSKEGVLSRRHTISYGDWHSQPIYELRPANGKLNGRALVIFHGHGDALNDSIYDYVYELPRRGYVCVMPILYGTMERQTHPIVDCSKGFFPEYCREWLLEADKIGVSLLGLRLLDARLAYQLALSLDDIDENRIGTVGLSMGGQLSLYLPAIETNIKCAVSAGFLDTFEGLLIRSRNCHCYSIRGWQQWFDITDIVGCIAPRSLLVLKGENDSCFFTKDVEQASQKVERIYSIFKAKDNYSYRTYPGEHVLNIDVTDQWLRQFL